MTYANNRVHACREAFSAPANRAAYLFAWHAEPKPTTRLGAALVAWRRRLKPLPPIRPGDGFYALCCESHILGTG